MRGNIKKKNCFFDVDDERTNITLGTDEWRHRDCGADVPRGS